MQKVGSPFSLFHNVHTYPDIFEKASLFIRFWLASTRRRRFQALKTKLFENAVQSGSFRKMLYENSDATAPICHQSDHVSYIGVRISNVVIKYRVSKGAVFLWTGIFSKTSLVWTQIFFKYTDEICVFKNFQIRADIAHSL